MVRLASAGGANDRFEWDELAGGWKVLLGCVLGNAVGVIALPTTAVALFMPKLTSEYGWSRTGVAGGLSLLVAALVVASPAVGWLCDRLPSRLVAVTSLVAMGLCLALLSLTNQDIHWWLAGFAVMGFVASGCSPVPFARMISARFERARGLALGFAMIGTGVTNVLLPPVLLPVVREYGWRVGFLTLAGIALASAPLLYGLLGGTRPGDRRTPSVTGRSSVSLSAALSSSPFWVLALCFAMVALAAAGIQVHFVSMLTDARLPPARVGLLATLTGIATIVVRIATGWLLDRVFAPRLAASMMAAAALCLAAFGWFGIAAAPLGAAAYGLAIGSEIDLVGYMTARYFGMRAYGKIYGLLYAAILVGSLISPILYGRVADGTGSYVFALFGSAAVLIAAAAALLALPAFPAANVVLGSGDDQGHVPTVD